MAAAHDAEQAVQLVERNDCCAGIIDCLRQRLDGDVHDDPERESRVLLDGALRASRNRPVQHAIVRLGGPAVQQEQRLPHRKEVADLAGKLE